MEETQKRKFSEIDRELKLMEDGVLLVEATSKHNLEMFIYKMEVERKRMKEDMKKMNERIEEICSLLKLPPSPQAKWLERKVLHSK